MKGRAKKSSVENDSITAIFIVGLSVCIFCALSIFPSTIQSVSAEPSYDYEQSSSSAYSSSSSSAAYNSSVSSDPFSLNPCDPPDTEPTITITGDIWFGLLTNIRDENGSIMTITEYYQKNYFFAGEERIVDDYDYTEFLWNYSKCKYEPSHRYVWNYDTTTQYKPDLIEQATNEMMGFISYAEDEVVVSNDAVSWHNDDNQIFIPKLGFVPHYQSNFIYPDSDQLLKDGKEKEYHYNENELSAIVTSTYRNGQITDVDVEAFGDGSSSSEGIAP